MADRISTARPSDAQLFSKKASFIQHSLPGLEAGVYQMSVHQDFKDDKGAAVNTGGTLAITRQFGVQGPRYALSANAVHSVFPPRAAAGGFSNSLAHVVLAQEKLPWIRTPYRPGQEPAVDERHYTVTFGGAPHDVTYDDDKASWLAVLLVTPADLAGQDPERQLVRGSAVDLAPATMKVKAPGGGTVPGALPAGGYSIFSYTLEPGQAPPGGTIDPGVGHTSDEACLYIDLPAALFDRIAPSLADLQMMAHVRAVDMDSKPIQDNEIVTATERYAIVVGNRLPQTTPATQVPPALQPAPAVGKNVALLVSLENMQEALRGHSADGYYATQVATSAGGFVRLPVFYSWSFVSWHDTSFEFEQILKGLNGRDPTASNDGPKVPNSLMRRPDPPKFDNPTDGQTIAQEMLELGYTPMNHLTRVPNVGGGDTEKIQTVSWYRGPLVPFAVDPNIDFVSNPSGAPENQTPLIYSADQLLRFDPNVGLYDASYAAAWQIGRLLSLQDKSFSVALYRWKKSVDQKFRMMLEDQVLQQDFGDLMQFYRGMLAGARDSQAEKVMYTSVLTLLAQPKAR
jgi:hypothetical protein